MVEDDPVRLLQRIRNTNGRGDVYLVGGPKTIEAFRQIGALDVFGLIVVPVLVGSGLQLTPSVATDQRLRLESVRGLPTGAVELFYALAQ